MWMPGDQSRKAMLDRQIIASQVDSHPVGRRLTPEAREQAITSGVAAWKGQTGNRAAAEAGIRQVTKGILKD